MVSHHHPDGDGVLRPIVPADCPYADGEPCRVSIHHWRDRKTGPGHPLGVARCAAHGRAFTLYPPGWSPYGRVRVAPARDDGSPVGPQPLDRWHATAFAAAIDAAAGTAWSRDGAYSESGRWGTQCRQLARLALLVGVDGQSGLDHVHAVAQVLAVSTQRVLDAARGLAGAGARGLYQAAGQAVMAVLEALPAHRAPLSALLRIGHAVGLWGPVFLVTTTPRRTLSQLATLRVNDFDP